MKLLISFFLLFLAHSTLAKSDTEQTLLERENEFDRALAKGDLSAIENMLAPGFVYTENATLMTKKEVLDSIKAQQTTAAENKEMKVLFYGDIAVVTGILETKGTGKDGSFDRRYRFIDTWLTRTTNDN